MVALAEMGDKTQLLSFVLAARFRGQHVAIIAGIFIATVLNHLLAAWLGHWVGSSLDPAIMRWVLGLAFIAFACWALIPDRLDEDEQPRTAAGAFLTTVIAFFIAEMGDKTQLATVALGAQYANLLAVTLGTTLGMMVANVPAVLLGEKLMQRFPLAKVRFAAAALFFVFGLLILLNVGWGA